MKTAAFLTTLVAVALLIACEESSEIVGDGDPSWSPDGTRIAFASDEGGNLDIYVLTVGFQMNRPSNGRLLLLRPNVMQLKRPSIGDSLRRMLESNSIDSTRHSHMDRVL